jgi:hypothetical protein
LRAEVERLNGIVVRNYIEIDGLRALIQKQLDRGPYWEWQFEARRALEAK